MRMQSPAPVGFREYALAHPVKATMSHYHVGRATFVLWANEVGIMEQITARATNPVARVQAKPMPADFPERAHLSIRKLKEIYPDISREKLAQFRRELGVTEPDHSDRGMPVPDDFVRTVRSMYIVQAARHYEVSESVIRRWAGMSGARFQTWNLGGHAPQAMRTNIDATLAGQAAHHLRRAGYPNIYKAEILSESERRRLQVPNKGKGYYVVAGKGALPAAEMIALAEAKGFDPRSWARI